MSATLVLHGELNIYRAAELKQELLAAVAAAPSLALDLSGVGELDTAGLQVLMIAKQAANALGHELHLCRHSAAVLEVFELLDLGAWFGDALTLGAS